MHYEETADREYKEWESKGGVKIVRNKRNTTTGGEEGGDGNPAPTSKSATPSPPFSSSYRSTSLTLSLMSLL